MFNRRAFLSNWLSLTAIGPISRLTAAPKLATTPFTLGVASGDPAPDGFVLWTRLAPDPLNNGGLPNEAYEVNCVIAEDEKLSKGVRKHKAIASPNLGHSVHLEVGGLKPDRWYHYQFRAAGWESEVGRTKTAPAPGADTNRLRFAFASCQHYETGFYTAYQHMAEEDLDLIIHLGDYIYEGGPSDARPRRHNSREIVTLQDYRNRFALYKSDPLLQRAHARFPWLVTWDDHEVDNDYANDRPEDNQSRQSFLERRANAYQAYYENMPLRRSSVPKGSSMQLYRRVGFGQMAQFHVLDTRQYRSDQPCGAGSKPICTEAAAPGQTILGPAQESWLLQNLASSKARWNVIANQVMLAQVDTKPGTEEAYSMDKWNGYHSERQRVLAHLAKVQNPIVVTGDIHTNWAIDLKHNGKPVGAEFVGTSISSSGDGSDTSAAAQAFLPENPHVRFFNSQRGYVSCTILPTRMQTDYRIVPFVSRPGAPLVTRASFVVENGKPGIEKA